MLKDAMREAPSIWLDIEDVVEYFRFNPHPSGIQRVALALSRALRRRHSGAVFLARRYEDGHLSAFDWEALDRLLAMPASGPREPEAIVAEDGERRSSVQRAIRRLPPELRDPLFRVGVLQSQVLRNVRLLLRRGGSEAPRTLRTTGEGSRDGSAPMPGDLFLQFGAPWTVAAPNILSRLRAAGVRTGLLVHDLIPVRRPEWQPAARVERFRSWLDASLPHCDHVFALSRFTADDMAAYARVRGLSAPAPSLLSAGLELPPPVTKPPPGLPVADTYVLYVSTLEFRKNHALLVSVWHKLMAEVRAGRRAAASVPQLVFAGRVGLGVADLLQQLDNSHWLSGRVRLIRDPSDAELHGLYAGCRFTLMPSLYEGWGLPVGESLAFGKPCLAATGTALPEAGGTLCRYFDPEDVGDAHRVVASVLDDPEGLKAWQTRVATGFRPPSWEACAAGLLEATELVPA